MNGRLLRQVRIEQSCRRLSRIRASVEEWLDARNKNDLLDQYATQLEVLRTALVGPLTELRRIVEALADVQTTEHVYSSCRANDERAETVGRMFSYFRAKFDQRDDENLGRVLRAADEVVWSCWAEPFRNAMHADPSLRLKPAPLPYIEPQYSPAVVPRDDPPADLIAERNDPVLMKYLELLPIPVIALPAVCADDPWWLVYIGHEVGHHLQFDLSNSWGLVKAFGELVEKTARDSEAQAPGQWRNWSEEIFADICSVYSMGPAAVFGIVELELDDEEKMLMGKRKYPPPLVRLRILAQVAGQLGLDVTAALKPVGLAGDAGPHEAAMAMGAEAVVEAALSDPLETHGPFHNLFGWNPTYFAPSGQSWNFREGLRDRIPLTVKPGIRTARLLTSAAVAAWQEVAMIDDPDLREAERSALAERFFPAVKRGREEVTRATAADARPDITALPGDVTRLLIEEIRETRDEG
jgi:hypothetical protein